MNIKKFLGLGVLLWLILFAAFSAIMPWFYEFEWIQIVAAVATGAVAFFVARYAKLVNAKEGFVCAVIWLGAGLILDALITRQFDPTIFSSWTMWLGYVAVFLGVMVQSVVKKP